MPFSVAFFSCNPTIKLLGLAGSPEITESNTTFKDKKTEAQRKKHLSQEGHTVNGSNHKS